MTRVLVVDDSVVVRRMLSDVLTADPRISAVDSAASGSIALQKLPQVSPDVVLLDVEMPDMDGIETVRRLRAQYPRLPVIMCSSLTERGADVTLRALSAGATDYVAKPTAKDNNVAAFKAELLNKVLSLGRGGALSRVSTQPAPTLVTPVYTRVPSKQREITALAIGCSTGGPNALGTLFERIPRDLPVPVFIVQHMPPLFTKILADRLTAASGVSVLEARDAQRVEPGQVYLAPGDYHLHVRRDGAQVVTRLSQEPPENSCRPAVDVLFRSLSEVYGPGVLGCIMTGMGRDGAKGAGDIVRAGGVMLAQSASTCVVPSMPNAVIDAGLADRVLPLAQLADELVSRVKLSRNTSSREPAPLRREA